MANVIHDLNALNGWPYLFYGGSALHLIWAVFWVWLVADKPEVHRLIERKEVTLIRANSNNILEEVCLVLINNNSWLYNICLEPSICTLVEYLQV